MNCYLHVGTKKTGSSSLQGFLELNQAGLMAKGFLYPDCIHGGSNALLAFVNSNISENDGMARTYQIETAREHADLRTCFRDRLKRELEKAGNATALLSSEHIHNRCRSIQELRRLREFLSEAGLSSFKIIIYLREQSAYMASVYFEMIKHGSALASPPTPEEQPYAYLCDYKKALQNLSAVFGEDNVVPVVFSREQLHGGSVISDFVNHIGAGDLAAFAIPEDRNRSVSPLGMKLLLAVNTVSAKFRNGDASALRRFVSGFILKRMASGGYALPPRLQRRYAETFRESNEWVKRHWFPDRESLFPAASANRDS